MIGEIGWVADNSLHKPSCLKVCFINLSEAQPYCDMWKWNCVVFSYKFGDSAV